MPVARSGVKLRECTTPKSPSNLLPPASAPKSPLKWQPQPTAVSQHQLACAGSPCMAPAGSSAGISVAAGSSTGISVAALPRRAFPWLPALRRASLWLPVLRQAFPWLLTPPRASRRLPVPQRLRRHRRLGGRRAGAARSQRQQPRGQNCQPHHRSHRTHCPNSPCGPHLFLPIGLTARGACALCSARRDAGATENIAQGNG